MWVALCEICRVKIKDVQFPTPGPHFCAAHQEHGEDFMKGLTELNAKLVEQNTSRFEAFRGEFLRKIANLKAVANDRP